MKRSFYAGNGSVGAGTNSNGPNNQRPPAWNIWVMMGVLPEPLIAAS